MLSQTIPLAVAVPPLALPQILNSGITKIRQHPHPTTMFKKAESRHNVLVQDRLTVQPTSVVVKQELDGGSLRRLEPNASKRGIEESGTASLTSRPNKQSPKNASKQLQVMQALFPPTSQYYPVGHDTQ
jgi:hypothetical protein